MTTHTFHRRSIRRRVFLPLDREMQQERLHVWAKLGDEEGRPNGGDFPMRIQFSSFALGLALSTVVGAARADVIITGTLDHLHIEASHTPVVEVMEALKKRFGIAYRYRASPDGTVDGTFIGPLSSVLPRVFGDNDYVFRIEPDHSMTVFFLSPRGPQVAAPIPPPQAPPLAAPISPPSFCRT
jgi:hypothetical protein